MRRHRRGKGRHGKYNMYHASGITINETNNNITNITQVSGFPNGGGGRGRKRHRHGGDRGDGKPELYRFFASCGMLDQHKAARMSDSDLIGNALEIERYAGRRMKRHAENAVDAVAQICGSLAECAAGVLSGLFG